MSELGNKESHLQGQKGALAMKSIQTDVLSNTPTSFSRLRGMTLWIMEILKDGGSVASWQVAEQTMKTCRYVNVYLFRLRKYGIAVKKEEFWFLTDFGMYLTDLLIGLRPYRYRYRYKYNTTTTTTQQHNNTSQPKKPRQVSIEAWLRDSQFGDAERTVVEVLVEHYNRTGSKFFYCPTVYDIAERFHVNPGLVNQTLMSLKQDHLVYSIKDPRHDAYKIGLYKDFVELLKAEAQKP